MNKFKPFILCFSGGLFLLILTFFWTSISYFSAFEADVMKWFEATSLVSKYKNSPNENEIVFIDVSKSKTLFSKDSTSLENEIITDRKLLAQFLEYINQNKNQVKYVLCDVVFIDKTEDDGRLIKAAQSLNKKFLTINTYSEEYKSVVKNTLNLRSATASFGIFNESVYKIPLFGSKNDTLVPLKMYHDIEKINFDKYFLFTHFQNQGISFNSQIPNLYVKKHELHHKFISFGLGQFVYLMLNDKNSDLFNLHLKDKYILIGDFENDIHQTYLNEQPGSLILFNSYWNLKNKNHIISFWYLLFLQLFFTFLLWLKFYKKEIKLKKEILGISSIQVNIFSITVLLILFTIFSNTFFLIKISIFHILILFSIFDILLRVKELIPNVCIK